MSRQLGTAYMAILSFGWLVAMVLNEKAAWITVKIITGIIVFLILKQMWKSAY